MARSIALLALTGLAAVAAQTTTVSVFMPMFDDQALEASIVAVDADKTTFAISCPTDTDSNDCGVAEGGQTVIYGPKTFALSYSYDGGDEGNYDEEIGCVLVPTKNVATCSVVVSQTYDGTTTSTSTIVSSSGYLEDMIPVTVTAGADKLSDDDSTQLSLDNSATATTTDDAATATGSSASSADVSATNSASGSASDSASATSTPTASDNAAGAMITQNAILAGAAVLVGGAMLL